MAIHSPARKLTYGDLVIEYIRLNQTREPFAHIPHDRYINFISDFLAAEKAATSDDMASCISNFDAQATRINQAVQAATSGQLIRVNRPVR